MSKQVGRIAATGRVLSGSSKLLPALQNSAGALSARREISSGAAPTPTAEAETRIPLWKIPDAVHEKIGLDITPISLRHIAYFGRRIDEKRIIGSAKFAHEELMIRLSHVVYDMACMRYGDMTIKWMADVYDQYCWALQLLWKFPSIETLEDNDRFCDLIKTTLKGHLTVIPNLALAAIEMKRRDETVDANGFMDVLLRSRISRRVIAQQHIALTETFKKNAVVPSVQMPIDGFVGEIFLKCNAREVVNNCAQRLRVLMEKTYGPDQPLPEVEIMGEENAEFSFVLSHLEYIIGEVLRNSFLAYIENPKYQSTKPPPIEVTIADSSRTIGIRICDRAGGIREEVDPYIFSFGGVAASQLNRENLERVPKMAATMSEIGVPGEDATAIAPLQSELRGGGSLDTLSSRPPNMRLGIGLALAKKYVEYWAGKMGRQNMPGYGTDIFIQLDKIGNKNEDLTKRAEIDRL